MDSIVKKLSEIEAAAAAIVAQAEKQKESLDLEYRKKKKAFDDSLNAKTEKRIAKIRKRLEEYTLSPEKGQNKDSSDPVLLLEQDYARNHTRYAQDILNKITEV